MKYRALESFSGALSMYLGEERELNNQEIIKDLLEANYIEEVKPEKTNKEEEYKEEIEILKKELEEIKKVPENLEEEYKEEIETLKKELEELKKTPENSETITLNSLEEPKKDVKSADESKRNNKK